MSRKRKRGGCGGGQPAVALNQGGRPADGPPRVIRTGHVDLGDLSDAVPDREPVTAEFRFRGARFRVHPDLSEIDAIDFMDEAENVNPNDPKAMTLVKRWARATVHPDDFDSFWSNVRAQRFDTAQVMTLMWAVLDGITDLPTGQPSASSGGLPNTNQNSPGGSSALADDPSTPVVYQPTDLYAPVQPSPVADGAEAFLRLIDKYQARGDGYGVAMAAQIAAMAEAKGVDVARVPLASRTG